MKKYYIVLSISLVLGCKQSPSQNINTEAITKNQAFWQIKQTEEMKNKQQEIFPKKNDNLQTKELRRNRIYLNNANCQFEAYVNDVLIYRLLGEVTKKGGGITGDIPVNQNLLFSGEHEIKIRMYPKYKDTVFGKRGFLSMTFSYFITDLNNMFFNKKMGGEAGLSIGQTEYHWGELRTKDNPPHKLEGLPVYEWRKTFEASVRFELEGWLNSVDLKEEQEERKLKTELLSAYKKLYTIIEKRDVAAYLEAVKLREDRISTAFYFTKEEQEERNQEFVNLLEDRNYEILPIAEETIVLEYQGYGKLAVLSDIRDGEGIIRMRNKENEDEEVTLDFRFHRKKKGDPLTVI